MDISDVVGKLKQIENQSKDIKIAHIQKVYFILDYLEPIHVTGEHSFCCKNFLSLSLLVDLGNTIALYFF